MGRISSNGERGEIVDLAARAHGQEQFLNIDCNQNEEGILGRLFQTLEKGVRGFGIQQVRRINDEDLVAALQRLEIEQAEQLPDLRDLDLSRLVLD